MIFYRSYTLSDMSITYIALWVFSVRLASSIDWFHTDFQRHVNNQGYFKWSSRGLGNDLQAAWGAPLGLLLLFSHWVMSNSSPWAAACQAPLSTISPSLLKLMLIELVMLDNHLILCNDSMEIHEDQRRECRWEILFTVKYFPNAIYLSYSSSECRPTLSGPHLSPEPITFSSAGVIITNSGRAHRQWPHWRSWPVLLTLHLASSGTCLGAEPRIWHPWSCPEVSEDATY